MSGSSPSLRELIDTDELQSIQDSFARAVGISSVIFSPEGEPVTRFTNPTGFCALIQSTEKGKARCFRSFREMGEIALLSETPEIFYCFADGGHFVAPIIIDGEHKGTMFAGQFIPEKFSFEQLQNIEKIAPEIDLDPVLFVKEAENMRVVKEEAIRNYSSLLFKIVETIAQRGMQAVELEKRVQERTAELAEANKGLKHEITERKLAEGALHNERDNAQHYLDVAGVMLVVIGADRKVRLINKKGCEILGYEEEEEIIGKDWFDNFIPEMSKGDVAGIFKSLIAGEIELFEYHENPVWTKDGEERIVAWHNTLLRDEQGRIYATMASGEDITERKQAEGALKDRVEFEKIIAAISTSFINLAPDEVDAGIEDALGSIGELFGVDRSYLFRLFDDGTRTDNTHEWCADGIRSQIENLKGLSVADFPWFLERLNRFETVNIPSVADLPQGADTEKEILRSGDILSAILVPMIYSGTLVGFIGLDSVRQENRWSKENITLLKMVGAIFVNALERRRAEGALRNSEAKFRTLIEKNPIGSIIIDKERKIRDVNDAAAAMTGRPREEIIGRICHEFVCPRAENDCPIYDHGQTTDHVEMTLLSKDRGDVPIEKTVAQIEIDGEPMLLEMFSDITKRKAAESALIESEEKYRNIIENIQEVFYRADLEGNLSMISPSGPKQMGYDSVDAMLGLNIAKTLYAVPEERDKFLKILKEKGVVNDYEITLTKPDGTIVPARLSSHFYFDKSGNPLGVEGLVSNITERKAAEAEIRKKAEELEKFGKLAVGRELKMIELKKEINVLLGELGKAPGYEIVI